MAFFKQMKWEELKSRLTTYRAKVPGGWLVFVGEKGQPGGLTFYPDPTHAWDGRTLEHKGAK
jgi:hypothetical protein